MARTESDRRSQGAPARDLSQYSSWRSDVDPENLDLMDLYSRYLVGQYAGLGDALSLDAARVALEIEEVSRDDRSTIIERLIYLHGVVVKNLPKKSD